MLNKNSIYARSQETGRTRFIDISSMLRYWYVDIPCRGSMARARVVVNAGYAHGTLLVCKDQAEFVFAAWAARGLNSSPPSASAPPRDPDFTGTEQSLLIRLRPSLLVCRTRRALSQAAKATHQQPVGSARGGESQQPSVPADGRFLYFNNRHKAKRGVGFGGSLKQFRLYFDASLERGSSMRSDATYADGVLTASEDFEIQCLEVWGCGGKEAVVAMEEWKETQSEKRRRSVRRAIVGDGGEYEGDRVNGGGSGVSGGGMAAKEDRWMLGLLGLFGGGSMGRDARQDAALRER